MVAVANPDNAASLVKSTYHLCGAKDAHVELIHMIAVPDQVSLEDGWYSSPDGREAMLVVMRELAEHFPISTTLRYCRNAARGIVSAVREKRIRMLVLGWHGQSTHKLFSIGSTIDPIIEQSPCDIVVLKDCGRDVKFRKVLVPLAGGPNGALALEIASILCEDDSAEAPITVLNVDTGIDFDLASYVDEQVARKGLDRTRFRTRTMQAGDPVEAILAQTVDYDLIVLGTTQKSMLAQFARRSIPEEIGHRCRKPTVIVKTNVGVRSWIKRWL
jgi:nucleotide-binding universal stress UspA family protein